jgi:hypothetical protein
MTRARARKGLRKASTGTRSSTTISIAACRSGASPGGTVHRQQLAQIYTSRRLGARGSAGAAADAARGELRRRMARCDSCVTRRNSYMARCNSCVTICNRWEHVRNVGARLANFLDPRRAQPGSQGEQDGEVHCLGERRAAGVDAAGLCEPRPRRLRQEPGGLSGRTHDLRGRGVGAALSVRRRGGHR